MSFCLIFNSAFINLAKANLSLVTPDGSTNTTIDTTPNNITIINIADSNSNGVSMNNFNQYNVDPTGLIINNSNINYDTNLAGWISANTHISNGSNRQASLIIEQVTGNLPSYLFGYTEIAGGKADLVLLNPNGMTCNGCGFININSMFLGTGTASYQSGMLSGINTNTNNNANISINGLGLNGTSLNSLSLISKQINLNATTNLGNTGTLILQQGTGNFNFTNQNFTTASTTQSSNIAIDASSLGSMYAGQIFIIANDLGVGVHLHADVIAQQQGITILDNGDLVYSKTIASHTNVNITANTLTNEKNSILFSQNNTTINADNITNLSLILAKHNLNINATTLNNGSTVQAAYITAGNDMQIIASQINNIGQDNGLLTENNAYTITTQAVGANLYVNSPPQITSQEVTTNLLTSSNSRIIANNNLIIQGNVFNQTGDILSGNNLTIIGNVTNNITHFTTRQLATGWTWRHLDCNFFCPVQWDYWNTYSTQTLSSTTPTRIASANTLTITGNQISNDSGNATFNNNATLTNNISSNPNNNYASTFNNATNLNLTNLNSPVLDLSSLANTGMFINNANPPQLTTTNLSGTVINFTYPIETNPIFTNPNTFLSSSYFLQHLNFSPSRQIMLVGDPTYERQLIHDTIAKAGMTQYLSNSSEDALYQNGLTWLQNNLSTSNGGNGSSSSTYNFGDALTPDQINSLTTDIIIPVYQTQTTTNPITHQTTTKQILTPQIYFCNNTLSSNKQQTTTGGQIYSTNGAITIIATNSTTTNLNGTTTTIPANITNSGYIAAKNTVNIISQNSFTNNGGTINSNNGDININAKSVLITNQTQTSSITERDWINLLSNNNEVATTQVGTSSQIQNVSKLTSQNGNIAITSNSDLNIQSSYIQALNNVSLTSNLGSVNLTQNSSTANYQKTLSGSSDGNGKGSVNDYSRQTVANIIETGNNKSTPLLIQKQQNNKELIELKIQLSNYNNTDISKKVNIENEINNLDANNYSMFIGQKYNLQNQLNNINAKIDLQNQIDNLNQSNQTINNQLKTNANTGSITINSANQTNIIANQNQTSNQYTYNASSFSGTTKNQEDLNIAETISPLLSSKDITINSGLSGNINNTNNTNGINNINLLSSILTGQGNLTLNANNGNINMNSLQDQYYYYSKHELTNLDIGALIAEILAAIIIGALTGGAGAALMGVAMIGMNAAIDNKNNGAGATKDMQTGFSDSTTKQYGAKVGNSLLFGGNVNTNTGSISNNSVNIDSSTSISSSNLNQTAKNNESANYQHEHKNITTDVGKIMTDIAINVAVAVGAEVLGPLLESGVSKLGSFVSDSFGLSKAGGDLATSSFTKAQLDDLALSQGINESNNVGVRMVGSNTDDLVAARVMQRPVEGSLGKVADHHEIFYDNGSHLGVHADNGLWNKTYTIRPDDAMNLSQYKPLNNIHYSDEAMRKGVTATALKNATEDIKYNVCSYNCQNFALEAANYAIYIDFKNSNQNLFNLSLKK